MVEAKWEPWRAFPDPAQSGYLTAPLGAGVYWLRDTRTGEDIYIGEGAHIAERMTSLLPAPQGTGTRNNAALRAHLLANLPHVEYRTTACATKADAQALEKRLRSENDCKF